EASRPVVLLAAIAGRDIQFVGGCQKRPFRGGCGRGREVQGGGRIDEAVCLVGQCERQPPHARRERAVRRTKRRRLLDELRQLLKRATAGGWKLRGARVRGGSQVVDGRRLSRCRVRLAQRTGVHGCGGGVGARGRGSGARLPAAAREQKRGGQRAREGTTRMAGGASQPDGPTILKTPRIHGWMRQKNV